MIIHYNYVTLDSMVLGCAKASHVIIYLFYYCYLAIVIKLRHSFYWLSLVLVLTRGAATRGEGDNMTTPFKI